MVQASLNHEFCFPICGKSCISCNVLHFKKVIRYHDPMCFKCFLWSSCDILYLWTLMCMSHSSKICWTLLWRGWICWFSSTPLAMVYLLHAAGEYCIFLCYKDFHFISNLHFGYFSFNNLLFGYNSSHDFMAKVLNSSI